MPARRKSVLTRTTFSARAYSHWLWLHGIAAPRKYDAGLGDEAVERRRLQSKSFIRVARLRAKTVSQTAVSSLGGKLFYPHQFQSEVRIEFDRTSFIQGIVTHEARTVT